jgi:hypothetical protein
MCVLRLILFKNQTKVKPMSRSDGTRFWDDRLFIDKNLKSVYRVGIWMESADFFLLQDQEQIRV